MRATINHKLLFISYQTGIKKTNRVVFPSFIRNIMSDLDPSAAGFDKPRLVTKKVSAKLQHEGEGAVVRRGIGSSELKNLDPFLMFDEFSVSPPAGFPDHPHRGFETVTYMLKGGITHQDFGGHKGTIHTGDVQWMTAGRGIIHSEMPAGEGVQRGLQLWINLSSKDKMIEPRYQEMLKEDIKKAEKEGVEVKIIAGESMGVQSPVLTRTPAMYLDFNIKPRAQMHQSIPESWNSFVYIIEGEGVFGSLNSSPVSAHHVLVLGPGNGLSMWNKSSKPLRFVLIGGQPLNEQVIQYGPFVMNTQAEIQQAIEDYRFSKNGFELAKYWRSQ
ncbi:Pirin domain-containing protein/Pirin_C domain-containing protein [Cephalotus follicularis]|uniref:Pirin domain-containing protein/Pirin_C domain-containing protein n=1 Tax=Cephalotus follicularis TaxID=3775 RepID=A0A1Q3AT75_CEPFO|nr:Pirin domain-containing protein/Pirin_C domain-containing protein [Cephalotus follicularis]